MAEQLRAPLSAEQLAAINARYRRILYPEQLELKHIVRDLLAEVDRLRSLEAALTARLAETMTIVQSVAEHIGGYVGNDFRQCVFCGNGAIESRIIYHADDCEVEQARALVAGDSIGNQ